MKLKPQEYDQLWDNLLDELEDNLHNYDLGDQLFDYLDELLWANLTGEIISQLKKAL